MEYTKIISWNLNGLKARFKELIKLIESNNVDIICVQEIKISENSLIEFLESPYIYKKTKYNKISDIFLKFGYVYNYYNPCKYRSYSGVAILSKLQPLKIYNCLSTFKSSSYTEGRFLALSFKEFTIVNIYAINAGENLKRLSDKINFMEELNSFVKDKSSLILCGDINIAHTNLDVYNPVKKKNSACFTIEERNKFDELLKLGLVDYLRQINKTDSLFTYQSYRIEKKNKIIKGWRLDYFLFSLDIIKNHKVIIKYLKSNSSDHIPILCFFQKTHKTN